MKFSIYLKTFSAISIFAIGVGCSETKLSSSSVANDFGTTVSGTLKTLYSGYHKPSRQYTHRTCLVPEVALKGGKVDPRYVAPSMYAKLDVDAMTIANETEHGSGVYKISETPGLLFNANASAETIFKRDASSKSLLKHLAGGLDVNMDFGGGSSLSGGADVAMDSAASSRSATLSFITKLSANSIQINPETGLNKWVITPYGAEIKKRIQENSSWSDQRKFDYVQSKCGTHFLGQIDYGALFFANMKVLTKLESDKDTVSGHLSGKLSGTGEASGEICISSEDLAKEVSIDLQMYQAGGDPTKFGQILGGFVADGDITPLDGGVEVSPAPSANETSAGENSSEGQKCEVSSKAKQIYAGRTRGDTVNDLIHCDINSFDRCLSVFEKIVKYASHPSISVRDYLSLKNDERSKTLSGIADKVLSNSFMSQLDSSNNNGFNVVGYRVISYDINDFKQAGLLPSHLPIPQRPEDSDDVAEESEDVQRDSETIIVDEQTGRDRTSIPDHISEENIVEQDEAEEISSETLTQLAGLQDRLGDLVTVWSYVRDASRLLPTLEGELNLADIRNLVNARIANLQSQFYLCRTSSPTECAELVQAYYNQEADMPELSDYVSKAEKLIRESLKMNGDFRAYCQATAQAQFRSGSNRWRNTMALLARSLDSSDTLMVANSGSTIFDYRVGLDQDNNRVAATPVERQQINDFCDALSLKARAKTSLTLASNLMDGDAIREAMIEPLTFFPHLRSLNFNVSETNIALPESMTHLDSLEELIVYNANIPNALFLRNLPSLRRIKLISPSSDNSGMYHLFDSIYKSESITNVEILQSIGNRDLSYDEIIDLSIIPRIASKYPNRIYSTFIVDTGYHQGAGIVSNLTVTGLGEFFGFKTVNGQCEEAHAIRDVARWIGRSHVKLDVTQDLDLIFDPCYGNVVQRCERLKQALDNGRGNMKNLICKKEDFI